MAVKLQQNFRIFKGNDLNINSTIKDENSSSLNITGASVRWKMALDPFSTSIAISKLSTVGSSQIEITDSTAGQIQIKINAADTATIQAGRTYYHEIEVEDSTGNPFTVTIGHVTVEPTLI